MASFSSNISGQGQEQQNNAQTLQQQQGQQQQQQHTSITPAKSTIRQGGLEIPGCYSRCLGEPRVELHPQVVSYLSRCKVVLRKGYYTYRFGFLGSDGKEYWYYIDERGERARGCRGPTHQYVMGCQGQPKVILRMRAVPGPRAQT